MNNSNKGDGNEGGRQVTATMAMAMAMAMATMWAMAMVTRLGGNEEEGKCWSS